VRKRKSATVAPVLAPKRASEKWKCKGGSSRSGTQTSTQELALAKPVKASKKFITQSSGLSIAEKTSPTDARVVRKRMSSISAGGSDAAPAPAHAPYLFGSGSSSSNGEAAPQAPPQKCPRKSLVSMIVLKLPAMKGNLECFPFSVLVVENAFLNLCRF
jgi:hypothetical protein